MLRMLVTTLAMLAASGARTAAPDAGELTRLLNEFLAGAGRNDAAVHERFWAEDLIYTGSGGRRVGKADILRDIRSGPAPSPDDPITVYTAEDVRIQQYGTTALVAFRLVATTAAAGGTRVARFLNTGTFVKRDGRWRAAGWQATRMPLASEAARQQVASIAAAFHRALLAADTTALAAMTDEDFHWSGAPGDRATRPGLLDALGSGRVRYSKVENEGLEVRIHGDAAVVVGRLQLQRAAGAGADPVPVVLDCTLTFVSTGGDWKAIALHTSRLDAP